MMDFLGIPSCVGFGLHADSYRCERDLFVIYSLYCMNAFHMTSEFSLFFFAIFRRFLIFPNMGESLQSYMKDNELLPEKTVLQLSCRIVGVLTSSFVSSNNAGSMTRGFHPDVCYFFRTVRCAAVHPCK